MNSVNNKKVSAANLQMILNFLKEDGVDCDFLQKIYNEENTSRGSGNRLLFNTYNSLINKIHNLLKILTGEERVNIYEEIPVIDYLRNDDTGFEYAYRKDSSGKRIYSEIQKIPSSTYNNGFTKTSSLELLLKKDPYTINRIINGEEMACHFFNSNGFTNSRGSNILVSGKPEIENIYKGYIDNEFINPETNKSYRSINVASNISYKKFTDADFRNNSFKYIYFKPEKSSNFKDYFKEKEGKGRYFLQFNPLAGSEDISPDPSAGFTTEFEKLTDINGEYCVSKDLDSNVDNLYKLKIRNNDFLVIENSPKILFYFKYINNDPEHVSTALDEKYKVFITPITEYSLDNETFLSSIRLGDQLPSFFFNYNSDDSEVSRVFLDYFKIDKEYTLPQSGILNGLFCEPLNFTENNIEGKKSLSVKKWRLLDDADIYKNFIPNLTPGTKYFDGHLLNRGFFLESPLAFTEHDLKKISDIFSEDDNKNKLYTYNSKTNSYERVPKGTSTVKIKDLYWKISSENKMEKITAYQSFQTIKGIKKYTALDENKEINIDNPKDTKILFLPKSIKGKAELIYRTIEDKVAGENFINLFTIPLDYWKQINNTYFDDRFILSSVVTKLDYSREKISKLDLVKLYDFNQLNESRENKYKLSDFSEDNIKNGRDVTLKSSLVYPEKFSTKYNKTEITFDHILEYLENFAYRIDPETKKRVPRISNGTLHISSSDPGVCSKVVVSKKPGWFKSKIVSTKKNNLEELKTNYKKGIAVDYRLKYKKYAYEDDENYDFKEFDDFSIDWADPFKVFSPNSSNIKKWNETSEKEKESDLRLAKEFLNTYPGIFADGCELTWYQELLDNTYVRNILIYPETPDKFPEKLILLSKEDLQPNYDIEGVPADNAQDYPRILSFVGMEGSKENSTISTLSFNVENVISFLPKLPGEGENIGDKVSEIEFYDEDINEKISLPVYHYQTFTSTTYVPSSDEPMKITSSDPHPGASWIENNSNEHYEYTDLGYDSSDGKYHASIQKLDEVNSESTELVVDIPELFLTRFYAYILTPVESNLNVDIYSQEDKKINLNNYNLKFMPLSSSSDLEYSYFKTSKKTQGNEIIDYYIPINFRYSNFKTLQKSFILKGIPKVGKEDIISTDLLKIGNQLYSAISGQTKTSTINLLMNKIYSEIIGGWNLTDDEKNPLKLSQIPNLINGLLEGKDLLNSFKDSEANIWVTDSEEINSISRKFKSYLHTIQPEDIQGLLNKINYDSHKDRIYKGIYNFNIGGKYHNTYASLENSSEAIVDFIKSNNSEKITDIIKNHFTKKGIFQVNPETMKNLLPILLKTTLQDMKLQLIKENETPDKEVSVRSLSDVKEVYEQKSSEESLGFSKSLDEIFGQDCPVFLKFQEESPLYFPEALRGSLENVNKFFFNLIKAVDEIGKDEVDRLNKIQNSDTLSYFVKALNSNKNILILEDDNKNTKFEKNEALEEANKGAIEEKTIYNIESNSGIPNITKAAIILNAMCKRSLTERKKLIDSCLSPMDKNNPIFSLIFSPENAITILNNEGNNFYYYESDKEKDIKTVNSKINKIFECFGEKRSGDYNLIDLASENGISYIIKNNGVDTTLSFNTDSKIQEELVNIWRLLEGKPVSSTKNEYNLLNKFFKFQVASEESASSFLTELSEELSHIVNNGKLQAGWWHIGAENWWESDSELRESLKVNKTKTGEYPWYEFIKSNRRDKLVEGAETVTKERFENSVGFLGNLKKRIKTANESFKDFKGIVENLVEKDSIGNLTENGETIWAIIQLLRNILKNEKLSFKTLNEIQNEDLRETLRIFIYSDSFKEYFEQQGDQYVIGNPPESLTDQSQKDIWYKEKRLEVEALRAQKIIEIITGDQFISRPELDVSFKYLEDYTISDYVDNSLLIVTKEVGEKKDFATINSEGQETDLYFNFNYPEYTGDTMTSLSEPPSDFKLDEAGNWKPNEDETFAEKALYIKNDKGVFVESPDKLYPTDVTFSVLNGIVDFLYTNLEGTKNKPGSFQDSKLLEYNPNTFRLLGRRDGLYYKRYQALNKRFNKRTGPLYNLSSLLSGKKMLKDRELEAVIDDKTVSCIPIEKGDNDIVYMPASEDLTKEASEISELTMPGKFYYPEELKALKNEIGTNCLLTCGKCNVKDSCPFYDEVSILKRVCPGAETINLWVKDNELNLIVDSSLRRLTDENGESIITTGKDYSIQKSDKENEESFIKNLHKPYGKIEKVYDENGEEIFEETLEITNIEEVKEEIKNTIPDFEEASDSLGRLIGARYGTVIKNNIQNTFFKEKGYDFPKYTYLYDAMYIPDTESAIEYKESEKEYPVEVNVPYQDGSERLFKGNIKIKIPEDLKEFKKHKIGKYKVYLVSDDSFNINGYSVEPVIFLETLDNLEYFFDLYEEDQTDEEIKLGKLENSDPTRLYPKDVAQWNINYAEGNRIKNPIDMINPADYNQYWMKTVSKKMAITNDNVAEKAKLAHGHIIPAENLVTIKDVKFPGRSRIATQYKEPLMSPDSLKKEDALLGKPIVATYENFIRRMSIRICKVDRNNLAANPIWLIKFVDMDLIDKAAEVQKFKSLYPKLKDSITEDNIQAILSEQKKKILPLMKTNLRLVLLPTDENEE